MILYFNKKNKKKYFLLNLSVKTKEERPVPDKFLTKTPAEGMRESLDSGSGDDEISSLDISETMQQSQKRHIH